MCREFGGKLLCCDFVALTGHHTHVGLPDLFQGVVVPEHFPDRSIEDAKNYCRNPDNSRFLWCYTTDPGTRWEYCAIPMCADLPVRSNITGARQHSTLLMATAIVNKAYQNWTVFDQSKPLNRLPNKNTFYGTWYLSHSCSLYCCQDTKPQIAYIRGASLTFRVTTT